MDRNLLRIIANLPVHEQEQAIDSLVEAIIAEGLTEQEVERLRLAADDEEGLPGQNARPN